jgi:hypothetical protein
MKKLEYKGVEYELIFNLNVMEMLQDEYGSVEKWSAKAMESDEPNIKVLKHGFKAMLNEGIEIYNEDNPDKPKELVDDKKVGRIISSVGFSNIADIIADTVIDRTHSEDDEPKKETTKQKRPSK